MCQNNTNGNNQYQYQYHKWGCCKEHTVDTTCLCCQRYIENIHSRTSEYLFCEDYGKGSRDGDHPQGCIYWYDHGNEHARNEESFLYFMMPYLGGGKLYSQSNYVCYDDFG